MFFFCVFSSMICVPNLLDFGFKPSHIEVVKFAGFWIRKCVISGLTQGQLPKKRGFGRDL